MSTHHGWLWIIALNVSCLFGVSEATQTTRRTNNNTAREAAAAIPAKLLRYAQGLVKKFDRDGSGALQTSEWASMPGDPQKIDRNRDGAITIDELADYLASYARSHPLLDQETAWRHLPQPPSKIFQPATPANKSLEKSMGKQTTAAPPNNGEPAAENASSPGQKSLDEKQKMERARAARKYYVAPSSLLPGLPDWFDQRDADGDGQLTLAEFAPDGSSAQRRLFARYDRNGDGVITPEEAVHLAKTSQEKEKPSTEAKAPAEKKTPSAADRR